MRAPLLPCTIAALLVLALLPACSGCDDDPQPSSPTDDTHRDTGTDAEPDVADDSGDDTSADAEPDAPDLPLGSVPLEPASPWPKFRADAAQTGRTATIPTDDGSPLWTFETGKGIFSSPVIAADGTIYIGSADRNLYALRPDGSERWRFATGEIIDSAGLLDDQGHLYFGSGDGHVYALDAQTGQELWRFEADDPATTGAFIRWFEGNVAIGVDGTLITPNDNFRVYGIDRSTGQRRWSITMPDQTWSLPAVDVNTGHLYGGNNNVIPLLDNTFSWTWDGQPRWSQGTLGSIAASALLADGRMVLGGFDGIVHAYDLDDGQELWTFETRDHVYASAAALGDGTLVVASADGTVYALDPATGSQRWAFDWGAPLRSSPAVDGADRIYVGTGDGHLIVIDPDGRLRWAIRLVEGDRDDLNSSPAVGPHGVVIAAESGEIFSVPTDFCLRDAEQGSPRCLLGPDEPLPAEGVTLAFTSRFGTTATTPPALIDANQTLAFTLLSRRAGDSVLAFLDSESLTVTVEPEVELIVDVSADRRFVTVAPRTAFVGDERGEVTLTFSGAVLEGADREGLKFTGGEPTGTIDHTVTFGLREAAVESFPYPIPAQPGDPAGVIEFYRLAAPLPTLLPSYNQIGFDSLHFLIGFVEGDANHGVAWLVEATLDAEGQTVVAPATRGMFPFEFRQEDGLLTMDNRDGLVLEVLSAAIGFDSFRVTGRVDELGEFDEAAVVSATTVCGDIPLYGLFLRQLGLCNPTTDILNAFGAALLRPHQGGIQNAPAGLGEVTFEASATGLTATIGGSTLRLDEHVFALLVVDPAEGRPVSLDYGLSTRRTAAEDGTIATVTLPFQADAVPDNVRVWLMVDAYPAARAELTIPR